MVEVCFGAVVIFLCSVWACGKVLDIFWWDFSELGLDNYREQIMDAHSMSKGMIN